MISFLCILIIFMMSSCTVESSKCTSDDIVRLIEAGYSKNDIYEICDNNERQQNDAQKDSVSGTGEDVIPSSIDTSVENAAENAQANVDPSIDLESKANKLYVTASSQMQRIKTGAGSYAKALELYQSARDKIERITSDYAASNIAVALISDQMKIAGVKLSEFEQLEITLQILADAEQDPLMCALFVARTIKKGNKAHQLNKIAVKFAETGRFEEALETAATINDVKQKARALGGISAMYFRAGQQNEASRILSQALDTANHIKDASDKDSVLASVVTRHAEAGNSAKAVDIAETIEDVSQKSRLLADIGGIYAKSGQFALALEVANSISDTWNKIRALNAIADNTTNVRQLIRIVEAVDTIDNAWEKGKASANIAGKYAEAREFALAHETAGKIKNTTHKADALANIAGEFAETGQFEIALEMASNIEDKWGRSAALAKVADIQARSGQFQNSLEVARKIELATDKSRALTSIAVQYAGAGQKEMASQIISQAHDAARSVTDSIDKTNALAAVSRGYAEVGDLTQALQIAKQLNPGIKADRFVGSESLRDKILLEIANKSVEGRQFSTALEISKSIKNVHLKVQILASMAGGYAVVGQQQLAKQTLTQALTLAAASIDYEDPSPQEWSWSGIVDAFLESGQLVMAVDTARAIDFDFERVDVMLKIAGVYEKSGQRGKAVQLLTQILESIATIDFPAWKTQTLTEIAGKYAELALQPDENGKAVLHEIVQASKPVVLQLPWE